MLLWLKYLKDLEEACARAAQVSPGGAADVKTMCKHRSCLPLSSLFITLFLLAFGSRRSFYSTVTLTNEPDKLQ